MPAEASCHADETVHSAPLTHWAVALQLLPRAIRPEEGGVEVAMGMMDIMPEPVEEMEMGKTDAGPEAVAEAVLAR